MAVAVVAAAVAAAAAAAGALLLLLRGAGGGGGGGDGPHQPCRIKTRRRKNYQKQEKVGKVQKKDKTE